MRLPARASSRRASGRSVVMSSPAAMAGMPGG
jgi:hypothetical protein